MNYHLQKEVKEALVVQMCKIILLFSLLICNFAFSQDTTIVPNKIYILDRIQINGRVTKIWLTESGLKSTILYVIEDNKIKSLDIIYTNFSSFNFKNQKHEQYKNEQLHKDK